MRFRPCIDIHDGKVKQIVGGSLREESGRPKVQENFVAEQDAGYFAELYKKYGLTGGHVILLNPRGTPEYEQDLAQAALALKAYPGGLQIGGGVTSENAVEFIKMGASHVIVTSYVFENGRIRRDRLDKLRAAVGKEHLVLDLSCRKKEDSYYVVTDRWQKYTDSTVTPGLFGELSEFCDEFLVHGVDVEGKGSGIEEELVGILAEAADKMVITYAGGVRSEADIRKLRLLGQNKIDVTIGSALDLFGGELPFEQAIGICGEE
ncbi:phosphoribosylformimino-5-aminoimidazole carboxamide ribotide isomerase [Anaerolentibacter hominis]|uniref:phosphoribosylformimino-5-aminoimidazole carboxamide ribotide isomerase n=1 Tax=Anaerolentibacter hominis TaxID=3079009 RepID=UPI0031B894D8